MFSVSVQVLEHTAKNEMTCEQDFETYEEALEFFEPQRDRSAADLANTFIKLFKLPEDTPWRLAGFGLHKTRADDDDEGQDDDDIAEDAYWGDEEE